jgi:HEPN domain-containing protein
MQKTIDYWLEEAEEALKVADHLFEKKDFSYSLFFGHLAVEKIIKAIYVQKRNEHAPQIHNLLRLAEQAGITMSSEQKETLIIITAFNLESRYPDEKRSFRIKCTQQYTEIELEKIRKIIKWFKSIMWS